MVEPGLLAEAADGVDSVVVVEVVVVAAEVAVSSAVRDDESVQLDP